MYGYKQDWQLALPSLYKRRHRGAPNSYLRWRQSRREQGQPLLGFIPRKNVSGGHVRLLVICHPADQYQMRSAATDWERALTNALSVDDAQTVDAELQ